MQDAATSSTSVACAGSATQAIEKAIEALAPCPFCGGMAQWREWDETQPDRIFGLVVEHAADCFLNLVAKEEHLVAAWNRRTSLQSVEPPSGFAAGAVCAQCKGLRDDLAPARDEMREALEDAGQALYRRAYRDGMADALVDEHGGPVEDDDLPVDSVAMADGWQNAKDDFLSATLSGGPS